jgi:hypothetical protein
VTAASWRPFVDAPLFAGELLLGPQALPADLAASIIAYLSEVAAARTGPLHTCTAFNALHFGFDPVSRRYQAAALDPELFTLVSTGGPERPVLPLGTFVRLDRGKHSLWAEVVARYGADPDIDPADGWVPTAVSGAPAHPLPGGGHGAWERTVLDFEAFGSPLTPDERRELQRARQRGSLLDPHGHLVVPAVHPAAIEATDGSGVDMRDDVALYSAHLLGPARALLTGGPFGGLLTDPDDEVVLAAALRQAFATVDALLDQAPLRRFSGYATPAGRFTVRRRTGWPDLPAAEIDDIVRMLTRPAAAGRYTAVWPLLATAAARHAGDDDPLEFAAAADLIVHVNLAATDHAHARASGPDTGDGESTVDDAWQSGGVWRTQRAGIEAPTAAGSPTGPPPGSGDSDGERLPPEPPGTADDTVGHLPQVDPRPEPDPVDDPWNPDGRPVTSEVLVDDNLVICTVTLRETHLAGDLFPVAAACADVLADGDLVVELHHDGDPLDDSERVHRVTVQRTVTRGADGREQVRVVLHGVAWPLGFYAGIKVRVAVARGARRITATTTLLEVASPYGEEFRWDADQAVLAAALGLPAPAPDGPSEPTGPIPGDQAGTPPVLPDRYRGIDQLRNMIVAVLRRHGLPGAFGARRLTGPQLLAAMFGDDFVNPHLLWQVIYTCERLTDAGRLDCETDPADPDRQVRGGPDTFVWWPDDTARRQDHARHTHRPGEHTGGVRAGQVREQWVPPHLRLLPGGYQASDSARDAYATWIRKLRGEHTPAEMPDGYTFVRGGPRGSVQDGSWIHLAATSLTAAGDNR